MTKYQLKALFICVLLVALTPLSAMGGIYRQIPEGLDKVDVIIAGGKSTLLLISTPS